MAPATADALMACTFTDIDGREVPLARYRGQVLCIVNVASRCGFTGQYAALEDLWRAHRAAGLVVLGFPCDQFAHQEPGDAAEIKAFCQRRFGVTFPLAAKVAVNGAGAHPIFRILCRAQRGVLGTRSVKWNFTKFLVGRDGAPVARFGPRVPPAEMAAAIGRALGGAA